MFVSRSIAAGGIDPVGAAEIMSNFLPFNKIFGAVKKMRGAWRGVQSGAIADKQVAAGIKEIYEQGGKKAAELAGEYGAHAVARAKGLTSIGFSPRYHGMDGIYRDAITGKLVIMEAKGGSAVLGRTVDGAEQMSKTWIEKKIKRLEDLGRKVGVDSGTGTDFEAIAEELRASIQPPPTLRAIVASTKVDGPGAFAPSFIEKTWANIGTLDW